MDIRKFFPTQSGGLKPKLSSPAPQKDQKAKTKSPKVNSDQPKKRKKAFLIESDSEDETPVVKSKKVDTSNILNKASKSKAKEQVPSTKKRNLQQESDDEVIIDSDEDYKKSRKSPKKTKLSSSKDPVLQNPKDAKKAEPSIQKKPEPSLKPISVDDFFKSKSLTREDQKSSSSKASSKELATHADDNDFKLTLQQDHNKSSENIPKENGDHKKEHASKSKKKEKPEESTAKTKKDTKDKKISSITDDKVKASLPEKSSVKGISSSPHKSPKKVNTAGEASPVTPKTPQNSKPQQSKVSAQDGQNTTKPQTSLTSPQSGDKPKTPGSDKKGNFLAYKRFLERDGPRSLGSRKIPEAVPDSLAGLTFVLSGVLDCIDRDQAKALIEECGGKVTTTVSKNTKYLVCGREAGASKMEKAQKLGTPILNEDEFFTLLESKLGGKEGAKKEEPTLSKESPTDKKKESKKKEKVAEKFKQETEPKLENKSKRTISDSNFPSSPKTDDTKEPLEAQKILLDPKLWVEKYKPTQSKQIIGQQGAKSNVNKLSNWLASWQKNHLDPHGAGAKNKFASRFSDDGSAFKAALLSGPPGIGKTTTAQLVCKEVGYDFIELNASDTRSKKSLQQEVSELLTNKSLVSFCTGTSIKGGVSSKHAIIMDEVDGMAGNEDRGGVQELIGLIKASKIPIICICNDRHHPKVQSLSKYCFDLRFNRPRVDQIKGAMMSVIYKENLKLSPTDLGDIIESSNHDVRQVLHSLSLMAASQKTVTSEQVKADIGRGLKDLKMGPFDVLRKVFCSGAEKKAMNLNAKCDLFFHDYSIGPLFVQENYLQVIPHSAQGDKINHLHLLGEAADSLTDGDLVDKLIRSQNSWSLLPVQAIFSSVVPGDLLEGHLGGQINFPTWLGRNSTRGKFDRILQLLHLHMRLRVSASKLEVGMDYLPRLKEALLGALLRCDPESAGETIPKVLDVMKDYYLLREDLENISLLTQWPGQPDFYKDIHPKVKAAFTRAFNKEGFLNPYSTMTLRKKRGAETALAEGDEDEEVVVVDDEESSDDDIANDAMVKVKKPSASKKQTKDDPDFNPGSKGKGSGRGGKSQRGSRKK